MRDQRLYGIFSYRDHLEPTRLALDVLQSKPRLN